MCLLMSNLQPESVWLYYVTMHIFVFKYLVMVSLHCDKY